MINDKTDDDIKALPRTSKHNPYQFTADELRVLRECNRDSFFQRCVPLGTLMGMGTLFAIKSGYIKGHPRFGPTPKVVVSIILGYFAGKFSYQTKCAERLMQLPNSQIGEMLRQKRQGLLRENLEPGIGPSISLAPFGDMSKAEKYTDLGPNSLDMDTTRPEYDGLDDSHRPSMDNPIYDEEMPPMQKHATTYEELRKKNRDEFQQKRTGVYRSATTTPAPPVSETTTQTSVNRDEPVEYQPRPRTNQYGDVLL